MEEIPSRRGKLLSVIAAFVALVLLSHIGAAFITLPETIGAARAQSPDAAAQAGGQAGGQSGGQPGGSGGAASSDEKVAETVRSELQISSKDAVVGLIGDRRRELSRQESKLRAREALLDARERDLKKRLAKLEKTEQKTGTAKASTPDTKPDLQKVVGVFAAMKPKDAARIFNGMDERSALSIMSKLDERKLAPIMAAMEDKAVQRLTVQLLDESQGRDLFARAAQQAGGASNIPELLPVR